MEQNKEKRLMEQVEIWKGAAGVLHTEFAADGGEEEISFLSVVSSKLRELVLVAYDV